MKCSKLLYLVFISTCFIRCNSNNNCEPKVFYFGNESYKVKGCIVSNLENGEWLFYNQDNKVTEKGLFKSGIREGKWIYFDNKSDSIIEWKKYEKQNLKLIFNIPTLLTVVEDNLEYIKFSNKDSSKLFNIALSVYDIKKTNKDFENYYEQGENEIKANGWNFSSTKSKIIGNERILYFNEYKINITEKESFKVLNCYAKMQDGKIFEISCRYPEIIEVSSKTIFFGLVTNSFYMDDRFINPFDKIKMINTK